MKRWLLPLLALSLAACSKQSGDEAFQTYQQRLARVLDVALVETELTAAAVLAEPRDVKQPLPDIRLDLTDTFATRRCGLDTLIGERNSSLGRVYPASKQLGYELRFLKQLQQCISLSWDNTALLSELQAVYQQKQNSVHIALHNMLLTDDTLRKELLGARSSLPLIDVAGQSETWQALTELTRLRQFITEQNWQQAAEVNIEQQLQQLYQYNFAGRLQHSLRLSSHRLNQLNLTLASITPTQLCQPRPDKQQLEILGNIFAKYFITQVQQYTVDLEKYQQQIWPLLAELYRDTPLYPALEQRFSGNYQQMRTALRQHVTWWQALNSQCPLQLTAGS